MLQIGVIGAGKAKDGEKKAAEEVGKEIGRAGHLLICGGLGGVMEAAAKGAKSQGGMSVGILPGGKSVYRCSNSYSHEPRKKRDNHKDCGCPLGSRRWSRHSL